jgi:hypothetical protein
MYEDADSGTSCKSNKSDVVDWTILVNHVEKWKVCVSRGPKRALWLEWCAVIAALCMREALAA